jgi:type VI secretion system protein ImpE
MNAQELYRAGRLEEAIQALGAELRQDPTDSRRRTFLFELLCFAGDFERAEKQLDVLSDTSKEAGMGTLLYRSALQAERIRREMFDNQTFPASPAARASPRATLNGRAVRQLADADPRIGARLEVFAAGTYLWMPFAQIVSLRMEAPRRLRDLIWIPTVLKVAAGAAGFDLGEVLIPALTPLAYRHAKDSVRLGRETVWEEVHGALLPAGQKILLADGDELPILEMRTLEFTGVGKAVA